MCILIIRGPESDEAAAPQWQGIPGVVMSQLVRNAAAADRTIAVRGCREDDDLFESIDRAGNAEFVLVDPGACAARSELRTHLERMKVPYIEVHDDHFGALEAPVTHGRPLGLVQGYGAQSYTMALSMALERMGCAECVNDYHVGT